MKEEEKRGEREGGKKERKRGEGRGKAKGGGGRGEREPEREREACLKASRRGTLCLTNPERKASCSSSLVPTSNRLSSC